MRRAKTAALVLLFALTCTAIAVLAQSLDVALERVENCSTERR
jgi:hypothetical protein